MPTTIQTEFRILMYFDSFSAIELPVSGVYMVAVSVNGPANDTEITKCKIEKIFTSTTAGVPKNNHNILPPKEKDQKVYQSRTFSVSFPGEVIPFHDAVIFNVSVRSVAPKIFKKQLCFRFNIYFSPTRKITEWNEEMKIGKASYIVNNIYSSKSTFKKLLFHHNKFCSLSSYFHFTVVDHRIMDLASSSNVAGQVDYRCSSLELLDHSYLHLSTQCLKFNEFKPGNEIQISRNSHPHLQPLLDVHPSPSPSPFPSPSPLPNNNNNDNDNNSNILCIDPSPSPSPSPSPLPSSSSSSSSLEGSFEVNQKRINNELEKRSLSIVQLWNSYIQAIADSGFPHLSLLIAEAAEMEKTIYLQNVFSEVVMIDSNDNSSATNPFARESNIIRLSNHFQNFRTEFDIIDEAVDLSAEHSPILFEQHLQWDLSSQTLVEENLSHSKFTEEKTVKLFHSQSDTKFNIYNINTWKRKLPNKWKKKNKSCPSSSSSSSSSSHSSSSHISSSPPSTSPLHTSVLNNNNNASLNNSSSSINSSGGGGDEGEKNTHLIVFVHGFQGSSADMDLLKNYLHASIDHTDTEYLIISSLADQTHQTLQNMGELIVDEIISHVAKNFLKVCRLSFITFSMGGVITRAALQCVKFQPYLDKLYTYISLAAPHLGFLFSNSFISSGMKLWKKWANSESLAQLSMTEKENFEDCFLYRLSSSHEFSNFQNYLFFGSRQDKYCPFHSSVISLDDSMDTSNSKYNLMLTMVNNIHANIKSENKNIVRINVSFSDVQVQTGLSGKLGRTAHVTLLQSDTFLQMFTSIYKHFL